jgi:hypothetical protein
MTPTSIRKAERGAHFFWGTVPAAQPYGFMPAWSEEIVQWLVFPALAASGFAMWFAARIRKVARRFRRTSNWTGLLKE